MKIDSKYLSKSINLDKRYAVKNWIGEFYDNDEAYYSKKDKKVYDAKEFEKIADKNGNYLKFQIEYGNAYTYTPDTIIIDGNDYHVEEWEGEFFPGDTAYYLHDEDKVIDWEGFKDLYEWDLNSFDEEQLAEIEEEYGEGPEGYLKYLLHDDGYESNCLSQFTV